MVNEINPKVLYLLCSELQVFLGPIPNTYRMHSSIASAVHQADLLHCMLFFNSPQHESAGRPYCYASVTRVCESSQKIKFLSVADRQNYLSQDLVH
jgi:hypothetical protein